MRLLIICEDSNFGAKLKTALAQINYLVDVADYNGQTQFWARSSDYDLIIVENSDTSLIIDFCKSIREIGKNMPLLVIIESLTSQEAIQLFNCGVDDYTSKFNHYSEISMRVRALLRRGKEYTNDQIQFDDLILDCTSYTVARGKRKVHLTKKEFGLLEYLLRHPNQVLSRTSLIEHVWDINADLFSNSLETHILNLRKKIEEPQKPKLLHTVSGRGYKIAMEN